LKLLIPAFYLTYYSFDGGLQPMVGGVVDDLIAAPNNGPAKDVRIDRQFQSNSTANCLLYSRL
jgi:hypothetical protein